MVQWRKCAPGESPGGGSEAGATVFSAPPGRLLWLLSCSTQESNTPFRAEHSKPMQCWAFVDFCLRDTLSTKLQVPVTAASLPFLFRQEREKRPL